LLFATTGAFHAQDEDQARCIQAIQENRERQAFSASFVQESSVDREIRQAHAAAAQVNSDPSGGCQADEGAGTILVKAISDLRFSILNFGFDEEYGSCHG
jgi:hypothetical protein